MSSVTVRISESDKNTLQELKDRYGESFATIIHKAVEEYRRRRILDATIDAYEKMRQHPEKVKGAADEDAAWDASLADGLE